MKKNWNNPDIEILDFAQTKNNIVITEESDGIYAGDLGPGSPDGYKCEVDCS